MGSIDKPVANGSGIKLDYSVQDETRSILKSGIFDNPLIAPSLPPEAAAYASKITFTGSPLPSLPINWRFAESAAALKALEACVVSALVQRKYDVSPESITINTDHAQLFFMSALLWTLDLDEKYGKPVTRANASGDAITKWFKDTDLHRAGSTHHRASATNIYKTQDGKYFHLHGSLNPDPTLDSIGLPHDAPADTPEASYEPFIAKMSTISSSEMQHLATDIHKQAGTICETVSSYRATPHGKANAHINLFEIHHHPHPPQKPTWWPSTPQTSAERPLAGLKVVDLTRIIAAPAVTRGLAELGASVMRVTAPHLADMSTLHPDLNWGKWNSHLDLRRADHRATLKTLILDADVVVQGYRPGVMEKYGFGAAEIVALCATRPRGIISVRENCYGWQGPWAGRSGWQQISDAVTGISHAFGAAMGLGDNECVTPVFPNSDYMTGVAGVVGIVSALMRRAETGGSYTVDLALNYYNQWLAGSVGVYPDPVWEDLWARNGNPVFRCWHNMAYTLPRFVGMIVSRHVDKLWRPDFFEDRECKVLGIRIRTVKPIARFEGGEVRLGYNVGTRGNGVDQPRWPGEEEGGALCEVVG